jgi:hypothetical protein
MADAVAANFRHTAQGASYGRSADDYDKITPKFHPATFQSGEAHATERPLDK